MTTVSNLERYFYIQGKTAGNKVLDVYGNKPDPDTPVISYARTTGKLNQQWRFVPAGPTLPGWWYLQTRMLTGYGMTLLPDDDKAPNSIVMQPIGLGNAACQLWCLVPGATLGYWYVQSQYIVSNSENPLVIGLASNGNAQAVPLSFENFDPQAWGFSPDAVP